MNYAGFGKRLLAYLIDGVIIGLAGGILAVFFGYYFYLIFGLASGSIIFYFDGRRNLAGNAGEKSYGTNRYGHEWRSDILWNSDSQVSWEVCLFSDLRDRLSDGSIYGESSGAS